MLKDFEKRYREDELYYPLTNWFDDWVQLCSVVVQLDPDLKDYKKTWIVRTRPDMVAYSIWTNGAEINREKEEEKELLKQIAEEDKELLNERTKKELDIIE